jgi:Holliday junction resolvase RusA-like endonuclease
MNDIIFSLTVPGQLPSLKNRRRLVRNRKTGHALIIKSADCMKYEDLFLSHIPQSARMGYDGPVSLKARIYYQSRRSDLSVELLYDLVAKANIILNDRQIVHCECWKGLDRDNPRVHLTVKKWEDEA